VGEKKEGGEIYFQAKKTGENQIKETTLKKATLEKRTNDVDAKYSREIKICAYSNEKSYLHAQGVQFIIKAINKDTGKRETTDKEGTITVTTQSLHPDDLGAILADKTNRALITKKGENNPYYFTIAWKGESNEQILNFKEYYEGLQALDKVNTTTFDSTGGLSSTKEGSSIKSEIAKKGINSYLTACALTSGFCNLLSGAVVDSAMGVVFDCGIPALTIFKSEAVQTYSWLNDFYKSGRNSPIFGNMFKSFDTALPDPKKWNPFEANTATVTGGALGATQQVASKVLKYGLMDNYGRINTAAINDFATTQFTDVYIENLGDFITKNIARPQDTTAFLAESKKFVKDTYSELLTEKVKDSTKLWAFRGGKYSIDAEKLKAIMAEAGAETRNKYVTDFLQKVPSGSTDGKTMISKLLGGNEFTEDQFKSLFNQSTDLRKVASNFDQSSIIQRQISTTLGNTSDDFLGKLTRETAESELNVKIKTMIRNSFNEIADKKGIDLTEIIEVGGEKIRRIDRLVNTTFDSVDTKGLITQITNNVSAKTPIKIDASKSTVDKVIELANAMKTHPAFNEEINVILKGTIEERITPAFNSAINSSDSILNKITTSQIEDLTKAIDDVVGKNPSNVKITKKGISAKISELFRSPKFCRAIVIGAACGVVSNMAGLAYSKNVTEEATKEIFSNIDDIPEVPLENGKTYRMIIQTRIDGKANQEEAGIKAIIEVVNIDDPKSTQRMENELSGKSEIKGTPLNWTEKLNPLQPKERRLSENKLNMNVNEFRDSLKGIEDITEREKIVSILANSSVQKIIYRYAGENGTDLIRVNGNVILQSWVGGIIATDIYTQEELESEFNKKSTKIKDRVKKLIEEMEKTGNYAVTQQIADAMYSDKDKAHRFLAITSLWKND
jgi:uncharacterized protein YdbL (DUF1318 family)/acetolactate synthase small subunit